MTDSEDLEIPSLTWPDQFFLLHGEGKEMVWYTSISHPVLGTLQIIGGVKFLCGYNYVVAYDVVLH